jgi:hypothetical protein
MKKIISTISLLITIGILLSSIFMKNSFYLVFLIIEENKDSENELKKIISEDRDFHLLLIFGISILLIINIYNLIIAFRNNVNK